MMEMSMSMYASSADYWKHFAELLAQTMNETAAALGVEPDNEKMLEAVDALRHDAERYRWLRDKATTGRAVQLIQWMPGEMDAKVDDAMRVTGAVG